MSPSFLDRLLGRVSPPGDAEQRLSARAWRPAATAASLQPSGKYFDMTDASARLDAVGESNYQDALREAVGGWPRDYVTHELVPTLIAEPDNLYDKNAIAVRAGASVVGYLARRDAVAYRRLFEQLLGAGYLGASCQAVICGGGVDRPSLGIFLRAAKPLAAEHRLRGSETPLLPVAQLVTSGTEPPSEPGASPGGRETRTLWCERGQHHWERPATRGRLPRNCPDHR